MDLKIPINHDQLDGILEMPQNPLGLILFVHGSGSSRFSPRNRMVAHILQKRGFGTLLFDLLTQSEGKIDDQTSELRFNIPLLAERLIYAARLVTNKFPALPVGYFGASTGAAAALIAAAQEPLLVSAIVSRGGRPDLAGAALRKVKSPTLLLVGSLDSMVIELNQNALKQLQCKKELKIIEGATHLFEEPGTLELVAEAASDWFKESTSSVKENSR